jgi:glycogen(starch) synthase
MQGWASTWSPAPAFYRITCMRILFPADVFPPDGRGGAAWSSHALAQALLTQGHELTALVPRAGQTGTAPYDAAGVPAIGIGYHDGSLPFVRNFLRNEWLWPRLARTIVAIARSGQPVDLLHAQHVQTAPAAVLAAARLNIPVVVTVRDHWPWDYFATGLHGNRVPYPRTTAAGIATDLPARLGPLPGALALAAMPYILGHVRRRSALLARADAVIGVSNYIGERLQGVVAPERIHVLPNIVALEEIAHLATGPAHNDPGQPFLLFVGKLEANKGAAALIDIFREVGSHRATLPPILIAGDGRLRAGLEHELGRMGVRAHFLAWADHTEVLRLTARCDLLLFPSNWGEPLSRVLLEAAALGTAILAMPTGGTRDIIEDGCSGALARTPAQFAQRLIDLLDHPHERRRLGAGAQERARTHFAADRLVQRYQALYRSLTERKTASAEE